MTDEERWGKAEGSVALYREVSRIRTKAQHRYDFVRCLRSGLSWLSCCQDCAVL